MRTGENDVIERITRQVVPMFLKSSDPDGKLADLRDAILPLLIESQVRAWEADLTPEQYYRWLHSLIGQSLLTRLDQARAHDARP